MMALIASMSSLVSGISSMQKVGGHVVANEKVGGGEGKDLRSI